MSIKTDYHNNKHHLRHHVIPESNEGLDIGLEGQRFHTGRFRALIADTLDVLVLTVTTIVSVTIGTLTVSTSLLLSYLTGPGYLKIDASEVVGVQAVPIPVADGGTGLTTFGSNGYVKVSGDVLSVQTVPIPVADGGTNATTAAAARTSLGTAPLDPQYVTLATNSELTNERVLTAGTNVSFVDGGAGSTLTINATGGSFNPIANQVFGG